MPAGTGRSRAARGSRAGSGTARPRSRDRALQVERDPLGLLGPSADAQPGREERAPDLGLAVDMDARGEQAATTPPAPITRADGRCELRGDIDEQPRDEVREHQVE